jgi:hypothetical protein
VAPQPADAWVVAESDQSYQPDPAAQGGQAALGYHAGQGYQTQPTDAGYPATGGYQTQPTDAGYPATGGYQTYQSDHGDADGPSGSAHATDPEDQARVGEPPLPTDAGEPAADAAVEAAAGPDGDAKATPADEPINRGLLLKFLSSVRT